MSELSKVIEQLHDIPVPLMVRNPANGRNLDNLSAQELAEIVELGNSIRIEGQKQPCRVVDNKNGTCTILSGHRRHKAAEIVGLGKLRCVVLPEMPTQTEQIIDQLVENGQRADFSDMERCEHYQTLMKANGWSVKQVAEAVHVSEAKVSKTLTLKRLCDELQDKVRAGELKGSLAYLIATVGDPVKQKYLAGLVAEGLNRDGLEVKVKEVKGKAKDRKPKATTLGTALEKTPTGLERVKTWAKELAGEIERLVKLNLEPSVVADTIAKRFGKGGHAK